MNDNKLARHNPDDAPPDKVAVDYGKPVSEMQARIERYEAALDAIMSLENVDAANDMEGTRDFWDGVDTGLSACRQIARKALEGGSK